MKQLSGWAEPPAEIEGQSCRRGRETVKARIPRLPTVGRPDTLPQRQLQSRDHPRTSFPPGLSQWGRCSVLGGMGRKSDGHSWRPKFQAIPFEQRAEFVSAADAGEVRICLILGQPGDHGGEPTILFQEILNLANLSTCRRPVVCRISDLCCPVIPVLQFTNLPKKFELLQPGDVVCGSARSHFDDDVLLGRELKPSLARNLRICLIGIFSKIA